MLCNDFHGLSALYHGDWSSEEFKWVFPKGNNVGPEPAPLLGSMSRAIAPTSRVGLSICWGHLCNKTTKWLVGLLGKIAVQCGNPLCLRNECLVSCLREFSLNFNHLMERLCARKFLNKKLCVFKRFLCVVAVRSGNRLKAVGEGLG